MAKRRRRMFTAAESAEVWDRWRRDEGLKLIGRVFDRSSGVKLSSDAMRRDQEIDAELSMIDYAKLENSLTAEGRNFVQHLRAMRS